MHTSSDKKKLSREVTTPYRHSVIDERSCMTFRVTLGDKNRRRPSGMSGFAAMLIEIHLNDLEIVYYVR